MGPHVEAAGDELDAAADVPAGGGGVVVVRVVEVVAQAGREGGLRGLRREKIDTSI